MTIKSIIKSLLFKLYNRKKVSIELPFEVRRPSYINFEGKAYLGENCKLLCWDSYPSTKQILSPQLNIGKEFRATRNLTIQCANRIDIGDYALFAGDIFIIDFNHGTIPNALGYLNNNLVTKSVYIGSNVWIGNNVTILPGSYIGNYSIIGGGVS